MTANGEFGINLVEDGKMYAIGCKARVSRLITEYEDGRMDIIVAGTDRYTVRRYNATNRPYLTGDITRFDDSAPDPDPDLLEQTVGLYNQLVELVYGEAEQPLDPTDWVGGCGSFRMAQKSGLDLVVRQQILEMRSEDDRMAFLRAYFEEALPRIRKAEQLQSLVRNDGYVRPDRE